MNRTSFEKAFTRINNYQTTLNRTVVLWLKQFWEFSCFYGEYKASLHSKKK